MSSTSLFLICHVMLENCAPLQSVALYFPVKYRQGSSIKPKYKPQIQIIPMQQCLQSFLTRHTVCDSANASSTRTPAQPCASPLIPLLPLLGTIGISFATSRCCFVRKLLQAPQKLTHVCTRHNICVQPRNAPFRGEFCNVIIYMQAQATTLHVEQPNLCQTGASSAARCSPRRAST